MSSTTYKVPDQRPQIQRLQKEREGRCSLAARIHDQKKDWICAFGPGLFCTFLIIFGYYYDSPDVEIKPISFIAMTLVAITLFILAVVWKVEYRTQLQEYQEKNTPLFFRCPNTRCPSAGKEHSIDACTWLCSLCGHIHKIESDSTWEDTRIIGKPCSSCDKPSSHFFCPHCNTAILLDETLPRRKAARVPGWVRPPRPAAQAGQTAPPGDPLSGFTDDDLY